MLKPSSPTATVPVSPPQSRCSSTVTAESPKGEIVAYLVKQGWDKYTKLCSDYVERTTWAKFTQPPGESTRPKKHHGAP